MRFDPEAMMNLPLMIEMSEEERKRVEEKNSETLSSILRNWRENVAANARHLDDSRYLSDLYGTWHGECVMLCGAGPSLARNIEEVKDAWLSGWKILCVDRCFELLYKNGIVPDLIISLDPQPRVLEFLKNIDERHTIALCIEQDSSVVDYCIENAGAVYFYNAACAISKESHEIYSMFEPRLTCLRAMAGTVGYIAFECAAWMLNQDNEVYGTIAMIGNELCWFDENDIPPVDYKGQLLIESVRRDGKPFYTIAPFATTQMAVDNLIAYWLDDVENNVRIFDCSDGIIVNCMRSSIKGMRESTSTTQEKQNKEDLAAEFIKILRATSVVGG